MKRSAHTHALGRGALKIADSRLESNARGRVRATALELQIQDLRARHAAFMAGNRHACATAGQLECLALCSRRGPGVRNAKWPLSRPRSSDTPSPRSGQAPPGGRARHDTDSAPPPGPLLNQEGSSYHAWPPPQPKEGGCRKVSTALWWRAECCPTHSFGRTWRDPRG